MRFLKRPLDLILTAIFALSIVAMLLANDDPFVRNAFCERLGFCPIVAHATAWNKIIYDIAVGSFISLIFYLLIVRLPENQRRRRLKKSFREQYTNFREECIEIMLMVADGTFEWGFHRTLIDQDKFKEYFKESVSPSQDRWDAFMNNLDAHYLQALITKMEILRDEISFILNNVDIPDDAPFKFLKRLSAAIFSMRGTTLDYDSTKSFARFLWSVFAGWDFVTGYRERDIIEEMIEAI
jgi:hypothetical protein